MTSDWLLPHCSKLPCTHFLRELSTLPETDENEERGKTELVEIQESCEQFSGRSSSPTVSVQNWSLTLWNKRANQISVSCPPQNYCQNLVCLFVQGQDCSFTSPIESVFAEFPGLEWDTMPLKFKNRASNFRAGQVHQRFPYKTGPLHYRINM